MFGFKYIGLTVTLILGITTHIYADDTAKKMQEANAYFETENYAQASNLYQQILQGNIPQWQRALLLYNIGRVSLEEKNWDQAITAFSTIPVADVPNPLLRYYVAHNLVLAYLGKARSLKDNPAEASKALQQGLQIIDLLNPAYCAIEKTEGAQKCTSVPNLDQLQSYIQQQIVLNAQSSQKITLDKVSFQEGIKWLLQGVNDDLQHIEFLAKPQLQDNLRQQYQSLFIHETELWTPLWQTLLLRIPKEEQKKRSELYATALENFQKGLENMQKKDLNSSKQAFEASAEALKALLAIPPPPTEAPQQPQTPQTPEKELPKESANNQVLQLLLQMSQQDMMPPTKPVVQKRESMPW